MSVAWMCIRPLDAALDAIGADRSLGRETWLQHYRAYRVEWKKKSPTFTGEVGSFYGTAIYRSANG